MQKWLVVLFLGLSAQCCALREGAGGRIAGGQLGDVDVLGFLRAHPVEPGKAIRADLLERTEAASYHLVQIVDREMPHVHQTHDLSVVVIQGRGRLHLATRVVPMRQGDLAIVPRGVPHWFERLGADVAVAFVTFAPPLDRPDAVPVGIDSTAHAQ
jgi:mannose-6-phosphate isomerase-like protein (cupin superfamily)